MHFEEANGEEERYPTEAKVKQIRDEGRGFLGKVKAKSRKGRSIRLGRRKTASLD